MDSSTETRPPRLVRALVLVFAIGCLGLAMCAHADHPARTPSNTAATAPGGDAAPPPPTPNDPAYFPATKAAGPIYPQQGQ